MEDGQTEQGTRLELRSVGIIAKPGAPRAPELIAKLTAWLTERGIRFRCDQETAAYLPGLTGQSRAEVVEDAGLLIVLGGDGTLLSAARALSGRPTPIFPVNLGGLGFLTAITVDELIPELERALAGAHRIGLRRMLHCQLERGGQVISGYHALNDIVITKGTLARMIDLDARIDGRLVCRYKADGLIVSTPTGSTAYSLSAGGPIVYPTVECLTLTPICPHMLTNRPVIVPASSTIALYNFAEGRDAWLTVDGQVGEPLEQGDLVICRRSDHAVHLIRPPKLLFFDVLREKLKWGER
jgi:NAD+ kinase